MMEVLGYFVAAAIASTSTLIIVKFLSKTTHKKYFISYVTQKGHQPALFQNCVTASDPVSWQLQQNENSNGMRYRIISWSLVDKKQAKAFEEGKHSR